MRERAPESGNCSGNSMPPTMTSIRLSGMPLRTMASRTAGESAMTQWQEREYFQRCTSRLRGWKTTRRLATRQRGRPAVAIQESVWARAS